MAGSLLLLPYEQLMLGAIAAVRVFVTNLPASIAFYRDKLGLQPVFVDEDAAMFKTGQTRLIIETIDPTDPEERSYVGRFTGISFDVADLQCVFDTLRTRRVEFDGAPERQAWGGVLAHFFDPDRNVLTLAESPPTA